MGRKSILAAATTLVTLTAIGPASAQQKTTPRQLQLSASNITAKQQAEARKVPADSLRAMVPGDLVEYRMIFTNIQPVQLRNVTFDNPVPAGLAYATGTATADRPDVQVEYSIDSAASWSANPQIEVVEEGQKVRRPAPPEMYTHVRWRVTGGVPPGARVVARYRARAMGPAGTAPSRQPPVK